jgi:hypothetical protein
VTGLGEAAQDLLGFARRTRGLDATLRDAARSTMIAVAIDEPLIRGETGRLVDAVRGRGVDVGAIVWNQDAGAAVPPLPAMDAASQFVAPRSSSPLVGADALREWSRRWRPLRI